MSETVGEAWDKKLDEMARDGCFDSPASSEDDLGEGVWFQSKVSGGWYRNHKAAGYVRIVLVDGMAYFRDGSA